MVSACETMFGEVEAAESRDVVEAYASRYLLDVVRIVRDLAAAGSPSDARAMAIAKLEEAMGWLGRADAAPPAGL